MKKMAMLLVMVLALAVSAVLFAACDSLPVSSVQSTPQPTLATTPQPTLEMWNCWTFDVKYKCILGDYTYTYTDTGYLYPADSEEPIRECPPPQLENCKVKTCKLEKQVDIIPPK